MKKIIVNSLIIFIISIICHFAYDIFPNRLNAIFFPVNESIFEHFKLLFTTGIIFSLGIYSFSKSRKNIFLKTYLRSMLLVIILSALYLPVEYFIGENMLITFIILIITIIVTEYLLSIIPLERHLTILNILSAILIVINYFIFTFLVYNPPGFYLFFDPLHKVYGLYKWFSSECFNTFI